MSKDIERLKETQDRTAANLESLAKIASRLNTHSKTDRSGAKERFQILTEEMRNRLNKLILSDQVTRELLKQVARVTTESPHN